MTKKQEATICFLSTFLLSYLVAGNMQLAFSEDVSIEVPEAIHVESGVESLFPIHIIPRAAATRRAMVLIRGMPPSVHVSNGRLFPSGVWGINSALIDETHLVTSSNVAERSRLHISLVQLDGIKLSERFVDFIVIKRLDRAKNTMEVTATIEGSNQNVSGAFNNNEEIITLNEGASLIKRLSDAEINRIYRLMERGDRYLVEAKIATARRFYGLAAEMGSPAGATAVARTYDPEYLQRFPIVGAIKPDRTKANKWYRKAQELRKLMTAEKRQ